MSRGIDYDDATLKGIFNGCLDDPLPKWEMENLKILDFWDLYRYLGHRIQWGMPLPPPKPACSYHSAPLPLSSQDIDTLLTPTQKRRARRKRVLQSAASIYVSETFPVTPESTEITRVSPEPVKPTDVLSQTSKSVPAISESVESTINLSSPRDSQEYC